MTYEDTFEARAAYRDALHAANAPAPGLADIRLPAEFWDTRPILKHIQAAAWSERAHPDAVLGAFLARTAATVPPAVKFNSGADDRDADGSTNLFCCLLAPSGIGKSRASAAAENVVAVAGLSPYPTYSLGSGEGLIEAYLGLEERPAYDPITLAPRTGGKGKQITEKVKVQVRDRAFFYVDEGAALNTLLARVGATLGPTLRSAWNAGELGQANATGDTTRRLAAGRYSLGLLVGYQPGTAAQLLAETGPGTPQRFLWFGAQDRQMPTEPMPWPGRIDMPDFGGDTVDFDRAIKRELLDYDVAKHHGSVEVAELDSHEPLMWCKVAALLCLIDGRRLVEDEDWQLAKAIVCTSGRIRDQLVTDLEAGQVRARQEESHRRGLDDVARRTASDQVKTMAMNLTEKAGKEGWVDFQSWKRSKNGERRKLCEPALSYALARGWVSRNGDAIEPVRHSQSGGAGGAGGAGVGAPSVDVDDSTPQADHKR